MNSTGTDVYIIEQNKELLLSSRKRLRDPSEAEGVQPIKKTKSSIDGSGGFFSRVGISVAELAVRCSQFFNSISMPQGQSSVNNTDTFGTAAKQGNIYKAAWNFSNSGISTRARGPFFAPANSMSYNGRSYGQQSKFNIGSSVKSGSAGSSMYGKNSGLAKPTKLGKIRGDLHAKECLRLEEKQKYAELLQQFTSMPADAQRMMTRTDIHVDENWTPASASSILPSRLSTVSLLSSASVSAVTSSNGSSSRPSTPGGVKANQSGDQATASQQRPRDSTYADFGCSKTSSSASTFSYRNFMTLGSHPFTRMGATSYITPRQPFGKVSKTVDWSCRNALTTTTVGRSTKQVPHDDGSFIADHGLDETSRQLAEDVSSASAADDSLTVFDRGEYDRMTAGRESRSDDEPASVKSTAETTSLSARLLHNDRELDRIRGALSSDSRSSVLGSDSRRSSRSDISTIGTSARHEELLATIKTEISALLGDQGQGRVDDNSRTRSSLPKSSDFRQTQEKDALSRQTSQVSSPGNSSGLNGSTIQSLLEAEPIVNQTRFGADWLENMRSSASMEAELRKLKIREQEVVLEEYHKSRESAIAYDDRVRARFARTQRPLPEVEDEEEEEELDEFPELTAEQQAVVRRALVGRPADEVLVTEFSISIKRQDMITLAGLNWLNDEVINFYLNLIVDRGGKNNLPKVYAFNTFFYPKVVSDGHASVKRWTRKVDIFAHDILLVPVHLGVHWCLAVIDLTKREIRYYDSMGGNNQQCLRALKDYLEAESRDKKNTPLDTSAYKLMVLKDIPQQMNGSDCGVFTCKFAEYASRRAKITFTQAHMPYFRQRMVLEIMNKRLL